LLFGAIPAIPRRVTSKPFPARSQRITEDARLLTSWHPEPVSAILVLRGVGILSLHPTGNEPSRCPVEQIADPGSEERRKEQGCQDALGHAATYDSA
jgi:hypothetical protein